MGPDVTALLKAGAGEGVRVFAARARIETAPPTDPYDGERKAHAAEIAELRKALEDSRSQAGKAAAEAHKEGRLAGLAEAEKREEERVAPLGRAIESASAACSDQLAQLEHLAPALARAALAKLFEPAEEWTAMVEAALSRQLAALRRSVVVAIHVSPADFSDAASLRHRFGGEGIAIELDAELRAGACRIECKLGQLNLDVRRQWETIAALLDDMAREEIA